MSMNMQVYVEAYVKAIFHTVDKLVTEDGCPECKVAIGWAKYCPHCGAERGQYETTKASGGLRDAFDIEMIDERLTYYYLGDVNLSGLMYDCYVSNMGLSKYGYLLDERDDEQVVEVITPEFVKAAKAALTKDFKAELEVIGKYYDNYSIEFGIITSWE